MMKYLIRPDVPSTDPVEMPAPAAEIAETIE